MRAEEAAADNELEEAEETTADGEANAAVVAAFGEHDDDVQVHALARREGLVLRRSVAWQKIGVGGRSAQATISSFVARFRRGEAVLALQDRPARLAGRCCTAGASTLTRRGSLLRRKGARVAMRPRGRMALFPLYFYILRYVWCL